MIYMIIPIGLMFLLIGFDAGAGKGMSSMSLISVIIGILGVFIFGFICLMGIANYAAKNRFSAAFEFGEIFGRIKSVIGDYVLAYIVVIILGIVISVVIVIPLIGWIIYAFALFYVNLVMAYYFATLYVESSY